MAGVISPGRERCQFLFSLRKTHCCTGPRGRRAVGRQAKGFLWRRSVELRASGAVGLRWASLASERMGLAKAVIAKAAPGGLASRRFSGCVRLPLDTTYAKGIDTG